MLIVFIILIGITAVAGTITGMKKGKAIGKERWEDEIRYVTIGKIEEIIAETDDSIAVLMKADWWEDVK